MNKTHEFYPMITGTIKTLVRLTQANDQDLVMLVFVLCSYPNHEKYLTEGEKQKPKSPLYDALIEELDRQYARWNKRGE